MIKAKKLYIGGIVMKAVENLEKVIERISEEMLSQKELATKERIRRKQVELLEHRYAS